MKCPQCNSPSIASILFGMPSFSEKLMRDKDEGRVVFGGCVINESFNPDLHCNDCKYEWEIPNPKTGHYAELDD